MMSCEKKKEMVNVAICFFTFVVALTTSQSLDGEWVGQLPVIGHVFVATFSGSTVTISVPQLKLTNTATFSVETTREPFVVTVPETNCYLQPFRGSTLRAIWKLNADASQLTIAVRTMDCVTRLPEHFRHGRGRADCGCASSIGRADAGATDAAADANAADAGAVAAAVSGQLHVDAHVSALLLRVQRVAPPAAVHLRGRPHRARVLRLHAPRRLQRRARRQRHRPHSARPIRSPSPTSGQWYCAVVADPAIEQFVRLNRTRVTVAFAAGAAEVILWESELGMPRKFTCAATGCRASRLGGADSVVCAETLCWCEHAIGCNPALLELLRQPRTDATFHCNGTGYCQFRQKELPIIIAVQCRYGQCVPRHRDVPLIAAALPRDAALVDSMLWSHLGAALALAALAALCCAALLAANRPKLDVDGDARGADTQPQLPGVQLRFDALHYRVGKKQRWLLRGVSGRVEPGELLAIIGASGAGKTTLLDLLAGWRKSGEARGAVLVDGAPRDARSFKRISGYVPQEEPFLPTLTVQEQLELTAELTFAPSVGPVARRRRVDEALADVGLAHVRHTRIGHVVSGGGGERGISGGERRRLSIANQLLARPRIHLLRRADVGPRRRQRARRAPGAAAPGARAQADGGALDSPAAAQHFRHVPPPPPAAGRRDGLLWAGGARRRPLCAPRRTLSRRRQFRRFRTRHARGRNAAAARQVSRIGI
jgi:ABC-type lipoprotein export system ATPase subunit